MARPSPFDNINLEQVKILVEKGFTDKEMASFFGVAESTWHLWKTKHPKFSESVKHWKETADEKVERSLFERATGYTCKEDKIFNNNGEALVVPTVKHYPPDPTSGIFWLKNRQPDKWRDKREQEVTVNNFELIAPTFNED